MKRLLPAAGLILFISSCTTTNVNEHGQATPTLKDHSNRADMRIDTGAEASASRGIASVSKVPVNLNFQAQTTTVTVCKMKFDQINVKSNDSRFSVENRIVKHKNLIFGYSFPYQVVANDFNAKQSEVAQLNFPETVKIKNPPLPDFPISSMDASVLEKNQVCQNLVKYRSQYLKNVRTLNFDLKKAINWETSVESAIEKNQNLRESLLNKTEPGSNLNREAPPTVFIVYQDQYAGSISSFEKLYQQMGLRTRSVAVSQLPGYDANGPIPENCNGTFLKECYHFWGDTVLGTKSPYMVPTLKGFHQQTKALEKYEKISYIPGLIRAETRRVMKETPLKAILLIGNPKVLSSFYRSELNNGTSGYFYNFNTSTNHTDIFYSIPKANLVTPEKIHSLGNGPALFKCKNNSTNAIRFGYFCESYETKIFEDPARPLDSFRFQSFSSESRILDIDPSQTFGSQFMKNLSDNDFIPVGRIVTQDDLNGKNDPVVQNYIQKFSRWLIEAPRSLSDSIMMSGGNDNYIIYPSDISKFKSTYGPNVSIYASPVQAASSNCAGQCTVKEPSEVLNDMTAKNLVSLYTLGHGGHARIQFVTAGNGQFTSFDVDNSIVYNNATQGIISFPDYTLASYEKNQTLVGHVVANSCGISNFDNYKDSNFNLLVKQRYPNANQISYGERFINLKNAGALVTHLNSDVGWAMSDNFYNERIMNFTKLAYDNCGDMSDALRLNLKDAFQNGTYLTFQVFNRHTMGSPVMPIAKKPRQCYSISPVGGFDAL